MGLDIYKCKVLPKEEAKKFKTEHEIYHVENHGCLYAAHESNKSILNLIEKHKNKLVPIEHSFLAIDEWLEQQGLIPEEWNICSIEFGDGKCIYTFCKEGAKSIKADASEFREYTEVHPTLVYKRDDDFYQRKCLSSKFYTELTNCWYAGEDSDVDETTTIKIVDNVELINKIKEYVECEDAPILSVNKIADDEFYYFSY